MRATAVEIVRKLQEAGFEAFWVGGCVRDLLLGREPQDYDIVTSAMPESVEKLFSKTKPVGKKFGVMLVVESEHEYQVATFRAESDYQDGRHPSRVAFGDAKADALRRDFTVNGMFLDPVTNQLRDWVGGEADLKARLLRTIGLAEDRFREDHLRMLRAVRFAAQLGFEIETHTLGSIQQLAPRIRDISAERIRDELLKLFKPPHASRGLELLRTSGLLAQVLPEIDATVSCEQSPEYHPEGSVYAHIRLMLAQLAADAHPLLPWAVLLHDVGKPATFSRAENGEIHFYGHEKVGESMAEAILERLRFPRKQIEEICQAVRCHMQFKDVLRMRKSTVRRILLRPTFDLELQLHRLDCLGSHANLDVYNFLVNQRQELDRQPQILPPLLTGHDLLGLGVPAGPKLGTLLNEIRDLQLQEELKTKEEALLWVEQRLKVS